MVAQTGQPDSNFVAPFIADYSAERRERVLNKLTDPLFAARIAEDDARLAYALSFIIADEIGGFTLNQMCAAMQDPSAVQYARHLLHKAGM